MKTIDASPHAATLIESFRDVGYSLETALADILDNSITAKATRVEISVDTLSESPSITVTDNGHGMTESELWEAMRPGTRNPLELRAAEDLGRFGLGLKTASFSQCRKLTVISRQDEKYAAAVWDLDHVSRTNKWQVIIPDHPAELPDAGRLESTGTVVRWDSLDRLVEKGSGQSSSGELNRRIDELIEHLRFVFHRYLSNEPGHPKISLTLNNRELNPFDPFNVRHSTADPEEVMQLGSDSIRVQTYTLPHHSKVNAKEWKQFETPGGYRDAQGFYIYRSRRLIISGTWFGLARKEELTKLVRVRVDIPNTLDSEWKIDVKKASAQPPPVVRRHLRKIIDRITATSRQTFRGRGERRVPRTMVPVWNRVQSNNVISYEINRAHPAVIHLLRDSADDFRAEFNHLIEIFENGIPIDSLFSDYGTDPTALDRTHMSGESITLAVVAFWQQMVVDGPVSPDHFEELILGNEPFKSNLELTKQAIAAVRAEVNDGE